MRVDVETDIVIGRPRDEVAAFAGDPDNAAAWYANIRAVEWKSPKLLAVGSQVAFVAQFLRGRLAHIYEIREVVPGERLVMSTADGPFPIETTYAWEDAPAGATKMRLRNRGEPSGLTSMAAPVLSAALRRANRKDLARLKSILEPSSGD